MCAGQLLEEMVAAVGGGGLVPSRFYRLCLHLSSET